MIPSIYDIKKLQNWQKLRKNWAKLAKLEMMGKKSEMQRACECGQWIKGRARAAALTNEPRGVDRRRRRRPSGLYLQFQWRQSAWFNGHNGIDGHVELIQLQLIQLTTSLAPFPFDGQSTRLIRFKVISESSDPCHPRSSSWMKDRINDR